MNQIRRTRLRMERSLGGGCEAAAIRNAAAGCETERAESFPVVTSSGAQWKIFAASIDFIAHDAMEAP